MNPVLTIGLLVLAGLLGGLVVRRLNFPSVTGYLIVGIIAGPSVGGFISSETIEDFSRVVTPLGLGIIAYLIGGSLPISTIKGLTRSILLVVTLEGTLACLFVLLLVAFIAPLAVTSSSLDFNEYLSMGIIIGAISLATAPAVTLAIIEETKSRGPLTTTLLGVVAMDDALAIIAFAIAASVAMSLISPTPPGQAWLPVLEAIGRVGMSVVLGVGGAILLIWLVRFSKGQQELLAVSLGMIVLTAGLADQLGLFPILSNMALGFVVINRAETAQEIMGFVRSIEGVVFVLFFTLAGAHLDLGIIQEAGIVAVLIVIGRCFGKFCGAFLGATLSGAPPVVRKYLGLALLPKAGVTIGLTLLVLETPELDRISTLLVSAVLTSTLINELLAPPLAKLALARSGETGRAEEAAHT